MEPIIVPCRIAGLKTEQLHAYFEKMRRRQVLQLLAILLWIATIVFTTMPLFYESEDRRASSEVNRAETRLFAVAEEKTMVEMRLVTGDNHTRVKPCGDTKDAGIHDKCAQLRYDSLGPLPKASVIITFHDSETTSTLVRTIHSVIQRTPDELLQEIIVIDDFSQKDDLGQVLAIYIKTVFPKKVSLIRNSKNLGLIKARLKGSRLATGEVLFFMDSHAEVLPGWLQPLLFEIKKNRRTIVNSLLDWIEKPEGEGWTYTKGCSCFTVIWDYSMGFGWDYLPADESVRNNTDIVKLRSIIGAFYAIEKKFFQEIGEYDEGMEFWGAENIDLPLRAWLFDGRVVSAPCSRAAHLEGKGSRSYRGAFTEIIKKNYKRLAEVWFDDYKDCFYDYYPELISIDAGNLTDRFRVRAAAHHDFRWYLQNVFPSLGCTVQDSFAYGTLMNLETGGCLKAVTDQRLQTSACSINNHAQKSIYWSDQFHLREPNYIWQLKSPIDGLRTRELHKEGFLINLHNQDRAAKWIHWKDGPMIETTTRLCLEASTGEDSIVKLEPCSVPLHRNQTWRYAFYTQKYNDLINRQLTNSYGDIRNILLQTMDNSSLAVTQSPTS